jgi:hypothetical protein
MGYLSWLRLAKVGHTKAASGTREEPRVSKRSSKRTLLWCALAGPQLIAAVAATLSASAAAPDFCAADYHPVKGEAYAYQNRGSRCEGLYDQDDAGEFSDLRPISVLATHKNAPAVAHGSSTISINWTPPRAESDLARLLVGLHIIADPGTRHYRMDTRVPFGTGRYDWPTDVLDGLNLTADSVTPSASVIGSVPHDPHAKIFIPLGFGKSVDDTTQYHVLLQARQNVNTVTYVLDRAKDGDWTTEGSRITLPTFFRGADSPFPINVPLPLGQRGTFYRMRISASLQAESKGGPSAGTKALSCIVILFNG